MRRIVLFIALASGVTGVCSAAPVCTTGSLSDYFTLGPDGCNLGSIQVTDFAILEVPTAATLIDPASITVDPLISLTKPGFRFTVNAAAAGGELLEILIGYVASGPVLRGNSLSMTGSFAAGDGAVTAVENKCIGGLFDPLSVSGCTGSAENLIVFEIGTDFETSVGLSFPQVPVVGVVLDIAIDGGFSSFGSATLESVTTQFTAIPEPASTGLLLAGLCSILVMRRAVRR